MPYTSSVKKKLCCQLCEVDLSDAKVYYKRNNICEAHSKSPSEFFKGGMMRWCQQCCTFQPVSDFDDTRRTCRRRLAIHNSRRRRHRAEHSTPSYGRITSKRKTKETTRKASKRKSTYFSESEGDDYQEEEEYEEEGGASWSENISTTRLAYPSHSPNISAPSTHMNLPSDPYHNQHHMSGPPTHYFAPPLPQMVSNPPLNNLPHPPMHSIPSNDILNSLKSLTSLLGTSEPSEEEKAVLVNIAEELGLFGQQYHQQDIFAVPKPGFGSVMPPPLAATPSLKFEDHHIRQQGGYPGAYAPQQQQQPTTAVDKLLASLMCLPEFANPAPAPQQQSTAWNNARSQQDGTLNMMMPMDDERNGSLEATESILDPHLFAGIDLGVLVRGL